MYWIEFRMVNKRGDEAARRRKAKNPKRWRGKRSGRKSRERGAEEMGCRTDVISPQTAIGFGRILRGQQIVRDRYDREEQQ